MTVKQIAVGVMLVMVGVLIGMSVPNAEARRDYLRQQPNEYALSAGSDAEVWRINTTTGEVSICENPRGAPNVPVCSPWSIP